MNIPQTLNKSELIKLYTTNGYSIQTASAEIDFAIEIIANLTQKDIILGSQPTADEAENIKNIITRRIETKAPLAQLLGFAEFMRHKFEVNTHTLIPRPETELLVNTAIDIIKKNNYKQVLDIGTGTGCIACMIAKKTSAQVLGVDISNDALKIALNNAMHLDLMNKALFRKSNIYAKIRPEEKFDVIVSNPPYIPPHEKNNLQVEVRDFEPYSALFTNDSLGMEFYEKIIKNASNYLNPNGYIVFEIGINQSQMVSKLLADKGFKDISILKDVTGIDRVIHAHF